MSSSTSKTTTEIPCDDPLSHDTVALGENLEAAYATAPLVPPDGGDFHAAFPLEDGQVAVVMGDVVGHGEEAAMHASTLCRAITDCLAEGIPPQEALGFVNAAAEMSPDFPGFATVFAGTITPQTGEIVYASGGHEPALLTDGKNLETIAELGSTGPPLGVVGADEIRYEKQTAQLPPGGTLLLYTDGISEARRTSRGVLLGTDGLRRLLQRFAVLPPLALVRKIIGRARAFSGQGRKLRDDAALLALRRKKSKANDENG